VPAAHEGKQRIIAARSGATSFIPDKKTTCYAGGMNGL